MSSLTVETQPISAVAALANWTSGVGPSTLQELLARTSRPDVLSLALGLPDPSLFPREALAEAALRILRNESGSLQYAPQLAKLRQNVVKLMAARGVNCTETQVLLTTGAQQGLSLIAQLLLDPGRAVLVEEFTYFGFLQCLRPLQPLITTIPIDPKDGLDVDVLERTLRCGLRPAFLYVIPEGHNPVAVSLSEEKRQRLLAVCRQWRLPIVEDDTYGFLQYGERLTPPLRAQEPDLVFYVGSFSKIVAPALRVGWLVVPEQLILPLSVLKEAIDLDTTTVSQCIVSSFLEGNSLASHLNLLRDTYRKKRDCMVAALQRNSLSGAIWNEPKSGLFIWLQLPPNVDPRSLLQHALEQERLAFVPGAAFTSSNHATTTNGARLNFSFPNLEAIDDGISRLSKVLSAYCHD
jgi:2-aminoadipate transaminase